MTLNAALPKVAVVNVRHHVSQRVRRLAASPIRSVRMVRLYTALKPQLKTKDRGKETGRREAILLRLPFSVAIAL